MDVSAQSEQRFIEAVEIPRLAGEMKLHGGALSVMLFDDQLVSDQPFEVSSTFVSASILV